MRILFVYTVRSGLTKRHPIRTLADIHFGISYVAAYAKSRGHDTRLVVLASDTPGKSLNILDAMIVEFQPQLIAFTAVFTQYPFVVTTALHIRTRGPRRQLILGGVHSTLNPDEVVQGPFDAICVGEGELPLVELIAQLEAGQLPHAIPNLWIRRPDGTVEKNAPRNFLTNLGEMPFPDRAIWHEWVLPGPRTDHALLSSRGCPYNCSYCSNHALRKVARGKYVRLRPPTDILAEIQQLKNSYPETKNVYLQSETIAIDFAWLKELTGQIKELNESLDRKIEFACNFRVARQFLTEELFGALENANVRTLEIGLESGSERIRRKILRRDYSNEEFFTAVALARHHGMSVNIYNMIGLPEETPADYELTVQVNNQVNPDQTYSCIFFPYPGTDLFKTCKDNGLVSDLSEPSMERVQASLDFPQFPRKKIQKAYDWFEYKVYRGHRSLSVRLRKVLRNKIARSRLPHLIFTRLLPLWHALQTWREGRKPAGA